MGTGAAPERCFGWELEGVSRIALTCGWEEARDRDLREGEEYWRSVAVQAQWPGRGGRVMLDGRWHQGLPLFGGRYSGIRDVRRSR